MDFVRSRDDTLCTQSRARTRGTQGKVQARRRRRVYTPAGCTWKRVYTVHHASIRILRRVALLARSKLPATKYIRIAHLDRKRSALLLFVKLGVSTRSRDRVARAGENGSYESLRGHPVHIPRTLRTFDQRQQAAASSSSSSM